jgi:hypothetical protein
MNVEPDQSSSENSIIEEETQPSTPFLPSNKLQKKSRLPLTQINKNLDLGSIRFPKNNTVQVDNTPQHFLFDLPNQFNLPVSSLSLNSVGSSTTEERNTTTTPTTTTTTTKRGRGRPKGSMNKPKSDENQSKKTKLN